MTPDDLRAFESWRQERLLHPDVSLEAYLHELAANAALAKESE